MAISRSVFETALQQLLHSERFKDYCPNGLQVEGREEIAHILCGVTASQALLDEAVARGADTVLVHHGYFWKGEPAAVTGMKARRLATLLRHDLNLYAYHLPLDAHEELGNNVQLAQLLNFVPLRCLDDEMGQGLVLFSETVTPQPLAALANIVEQTLGRTPIVVQGHERPTTSLAICTGGGQDFIELAAAAGADVFLSGEISERTTHSARELGINYIAAGHHATERYGIQALGKWLATHLSVQVEFVDIANPA